MTLELMVIRHAKSIINSDETIIGGRHPRAPLDILGIRQSVLLGMRLNQDQVMCNKIYSAPLLRHRQTAEIVGDIAGYEPSKIEYVNALSEIDYGEAEGKKKRCIEYNRVTESFL